ncbi:hypothetical protein SAMN05216391_101167 [Lachnospiraceae bacterium KHCPX20]|nr:hypothetical protein SAMN05216391_101167 [Lachnospiraceae bacterium KHCPX20]
MKILQLHLKLLIRTKWCWLFFPLFCFFSYGAIYDSLYNLSLSGYVTQTLIFFGGMFAYYNRIREKREVGEYVSVLPYFRSSQMWMLLAEGIYVVLILLLMTGFVFIYGVYLGTEGWLLKEAVWYCFIYFWLPCFVSLSFGYILGSGEPRKFHVLVIIILGFLVGPVMRYFWYTLLMVLLGPHIAEKIITTISLGQSSISTGCDPFYGFQIECGRIFHLLSVLFFLLFCCTLKKKSIRKKVVACTMFVLTVVLYLNSGRYVIHDLQSEEPSVKSNYDLDYYKEHKSFYHPGNSTVEKISGEVKLRKDLSFKGKIQLKANKAIKETSFILYHDLKVKCLSGRNVKAFEQKADTIRIFFDKEIQRNEVYSVEIEYEGYSSPYFYSNEKGCFLPGYFAWLPCTGEGSCFEADKQYVRMLGVVDDIYNIRIDSRYPYYFHRGTLISNNHVRVYHVNGIQVISPVRIEKGKRERLIQAFLDFSNYNIDEIILMPQEQDNVSLPYVVCGSTYFADASDWIGNVILSKKDLKEEWEEAVQCAKEAP